MEFKLKYILNFDFIAYFFMFIGCIIFFIWLIAKIKNIVTAFRSPVIVICCAAIPVWIYFAWKSFVQETAFSSRFDADYVLNAASYIMLINIFIWIVYKFINAYTKRNIYKITDIDNPKNIKKNIEYIIHENNFKQNAEMEKLYGILQVSALSIKKQKKIIQSSFFKNLIVSVIFFLLGLLIPEFIRYFMCSL